MYHLGADRVAPERPVPHRLSASTLHCEHSSGGAMDGFSKTYWNADQLLVWVWCRDRHLVHRADNRFADYDSYMQESKLPDGRLVMSDILSGWEGVNGLSLRAKVSPSQIRYQPVHADLGTPEDQRLGDLVRCLQ